MDYVWLRNHTQLPFIYSFIIQPLHKKFNHPNLFLCRVDNNIIFLNCFGSILEKWLINLNKFFQVKLVIVSKILCCYIKVQRQYPPNGQIVLDILIEKGLYHKKEPVQQNCRTGREWGKG